MGTMVEAGKEIQVYENTFLKIHVYNLGNFGTAETDSVHWFTPQILQRARSGLGQSQEPGTQSLPYGNRTQSREMLLPWVR